jgi:predicted NAD/FAD-dependent oxidoreductase
MLTDADHGAQFVTVRSAEFAVDLAGRVADGTVHVDSVTPTGDGWTVSWGGSHGTPPGSLAADAVVLTSPVPQSAALMGRAVDVPDVDYDPTPSLGVALDGPSAVPTPGVVQLADDPAWAWVGDNRAKGVSPTPAVTLHTSADVARHRWDEDPDRCTAALLSAASHWLGGSGVVDVRLHRWRFATPRRPRPERCLEVAPGLVLAGEAFGGPRVEGAFLSGRAAAERVRDGA